MMINQPLRVCALLLALGAAGCQSPAPSPETTPAGAESNAPEAASPLAKYTTFRLDADLSTLSEREREMIPLLVDAARAMDEVFWRQAYGDREALLSSIGDPDTRRFAEINYGPWDRLDGDAPFVDGVGAKPPGANFYPADIGEKELSGTREGWDLEALEAEVPGLRSLYTLVRRDDAGRLVAVPYHQAFADAHQHASAKLLEAAALADDPGLERYLRSRAAALLSDDYRASDLAWMEMKNNLFDVVIGPIETYEDQLLGAKAAHEAYVLVKDKEWSERLQRYAALLPGLQRGLPVAEEYRRETPGADADLGAYDVLFTAGHANAGSKAIAFNLPNDEQVQLEKGTRRVQMKNAMRAKFDAILEPIADLLIEPEQRSHVTFDAFFANTMFHEIAHGLGIKETISGRGAVRQALQDHASAIEEGKADVLGLYMVTSLHAQGELGDADLMDYYTTFLASIFRSIRFGSSSAHGVANLIRFNYFQERGAFSRDPESGRYRVEPERIQPAIDALSEAILRLQGDGDYAAVDAFVAKYGRQGDQVTADLARLAAAGIPVDIVFEQGLDVLGLDGSFDS